jgi:hypothetical protein
MVAAVRDVKISRLSYLTSLYTSLSPHVFEDITNDLRFSNHVNSQCANLKSSLLFPSSVVVAK